ncbi:MAG TPA: biotin--[acetyl-CoA-carboxylase] ligase [Chitinophagaceae bacterium]|nr:biotin--[acetyl-CoA-carboxylase] ligase [Chitinophagaceae bacterium]
MPQPPVYRPIGQPFIVLQSVDSTNNYALDRLHEGMAQEGMAILAMEQVAGKGQRGKKWSAAKGDGLLLSVVINPHPLQLNEQFHLSACIALAAADLLEKYTAGGITIKWPNDLYWQDRKAGGILIENIIGSAGAENSGSSWKWAVAGTGLNINQPDFPPELANPVSLRQVTGRKWEVEELARELCRCIALRLAELFDKGPGPVFQCFNERLYRKGQITRFRKGNKVFEARVNRVLPTGELEIKHALTELVRHGEAEWILEEKKQQPGNPFHSPGVDK